MIRDESIRRGRTAHRNTLKRMCLAILPSDEDDLLLLRDERLDLALQNVSSSKSMGIIDVVNGSNDVLNTR